MGWRELWQPQFTHSENYRIFQESISRFLSVCLRRSVCLAALDARRIARRRRLRRLVAFGGRPVAAAVVVVVVVVVVVDATYLAAAAFGKNTQQSLTD